MPAGTTLLACVAANVILPTQLKQRMPWEKDAYEQLEALSESAKSIASSLSHIAVAARLNVLYSEAEQRNLLKEYRQLREADQKAFEILKVTRPEGESTSYEERVRIYGKEEADRMLRPMHIATEERKRTMGLCDMFRKDHPLLASLLRE